MSPSEKNSSNFVETKQDDLKMMQDSSLNSDIIHDPKKLKDRIMDLLKRDIAFSKMKQGDQALVVGTTSGLFAAVLPLLAVGATLAIPGVIVGLTLFFAAKVAVKAVQSGYKGLKWSAEKTVEGAKHIGGKIKDGYEYSVDSLKRGTHLINEKTKEKASDILTATANKLYRAAGNENYSDRIDNELIPDSPQKEKIQEIKGDLRAICTDGQSNSMLRKSIISEISLKIGGKIEAREKEELSCFASDVMESSDLITRWKEQKKFIDNLGADGLRNLVTKRLSDKDKYFRDSIFSEHHDEIKEVITECKLDQFAKMRCNNIKNVAGGKVSADSSKEELLNSSKHEEEFTPFWQGHHFDDNFVDVASPKPPRSSSMGSLSTDSTATTSSFASYRHNSDSGFNSPSSSTPQRHSPSQETRFGLGVTEELTEKLAKRRAIVDQPNVESVQQKAEPSKG
ncbi:hypothetical protein WSTR_04000 [Wolbachia endosymbiont of Laodelphax striatellus]|uniref:actin-bundling T4SS effector WalE1 family protein n=1 Tax=Wolbachia endosymbiont of Laodelphax striatellus TaxID=368602 RepID=UPI0007C587DF|nr:hypothetical protein [Wolbachia endosymbiont of Laodelphax striatellus]OAB81674.1 hypothetical protein WSTR_04000 [Wolbachia endosymbiont of Laodelphax striatellus]